MSERRMHTLSCVLWAYHRRVFHVPFLRVDWLVGSVADADYFDYSADDFVGFVDVLVYADSEKNGKKVEYKLWIQENFKNEKKK